MIAQLFLLASCLVFGVQGVTRSCDAEITALFDVFNDQGDTVGNLVPFETVTIDSFKGYGSAGTTNKARNEAKKFINRCFAAAKALADTPIKNEIPDACAAKQIEEFETANLFCTIVQEICHVMEIDNQAGNSFGNVVVRFKSSGDGGCALNSDIHHIQFANCSPEYFSITGCPGY